MNQLQQVEYSIEQLKLRKAKAAKFAKLMNNREFKEFILDEYLIQEPARVTTLLVHPQLREGSISQLMAISRLGEHLNTLEKMFATVDADLEEAEYVREQMLAEDLMDNEV